MYKVNIPVNCDEFHRMKDKNQLLNKSQVNSQQGGNYIEELRQLKQLLDMGVITEEEFNIKKRMLLGF